MGTDQVSQRKALSNAERQALYRARRASERITEQQLRDMLAAAYDLGRHDAVHRSAVRTAQAIYDRVADQIAADQINAERKHGMKNA